MDRYMMICGINLEGIPMFQLVERPSILGSGHWQVVAVGPDFDSLIRLCTYANIAAAENDAVHAMEGASNAR